MSFNIEGSGWRVEEIDETTAPIVGVKFYNVFNHAFMWARYDQGKMLYIDPHPVNVLPAVKK